MLATLVNKSVVIVLLILVVLSLGSAIKSLVLGRDQGHALLRALTWRIGLSLLAFIAVLIGYYQGWWQPHGLLPLPA
jgi:hypothetical protein